MSFFEQLSGIKTLEINEPRNNHPYILPSLCLLQHSNTTGVNRCGDKFIVSGAGVVT
jgi:hypothetical protein